ncbi:glycosyl hydrolase family 28-related protein [Blastococcus sp. VKM Ac-2987]|uniref:glycosyl hydrolase family 28-related protein n=1 Tax=Blastococcus sp. VKM Ac-2987 TaxID=3004141 RepID=UPI0022AB53F7|nr:glycosyl hydrolase family 28-related protein [Blastococcus sp. VKM Ac-2987]MCZ2858497.1 glycosyl hydrolase family 28-related protein [Blastococcus sp. VKM Ac-2987]
MSDSVSRRRLLGVTLAAAAGLPVAAACTSRGTGAAGDSAEALDVLPSATNVRDLGAVGDGVADDTAAIAEAYAGAEGPVVLYLPAGKYLVSAWPALPDYSVVIGEGGDATTIIHQGSGALFALEGRHRVAFRRFGVHVTRPGGSAVSLSACFRCSFDSVVLRGSHLSENFPQFADQQGVILSDNTGGTTFVNCDINNFGTGLVTSCIQNYVTASKFTNNYVGVLGTGGDYNAGLSIVNSEFVSDNDPDTTSTHVRIDGPANDWWITNVWFEGADVAISAGDPGRGGPAQFGLVNCKVAARSTCVELLHCRQPYLANVLFDPDLDSPPTPLRIDPQYCAEGTAVNLVSGFADDIDLEAFPPGWSVTARGVISGAAHVGPLSLRAGPRGGDLLEARDATGSVVSAVLPTGAFLSDRPEGGVVLRDEAGGYWRLSVGRDGALRTTALGDVRPLA